MKAASQVVTNDYFDSIELILKQSIDTNDLYSTVVNAPFSNLRVTTTLGLGIVVLLLNDAQTHTIKRMALSNTEQAHGAVQASVKPFNKIVIPSNHKTNIIAQALREGKPKTTSDWSNLFAPALTKEEARFNQAGAGIGCSYVYPLLGTDAALIFSYFLHPSEITSAQTDFMERYSHLAATCLQTDK